MPGHAGGQAGSGGKSFLVRGGRGQAGQQAQFQTVGLQQENSPVASRVGALGIGKYALPGAASLADHGIEKGRREEPLGVVGNYDGSGVGQIAL